MAGMLLRYSVRVGDAVAEGQEVAVLESMKMEVPVAATAGGTIAALQAEVGAFVQEGELLVSVQ
jgi:acetyl-CoA carboxylase biotin carboxyl carrier protein